ncbi:arginine--tRNA ligase [Haematospirillum sp. 15-248]|uniref:arginine--tRNA ligase n=1 Tax=Haematospirillum sp. 15-248 TaxID=2723107 RepID=UPI00143A28EC|nr:arginine--tRNA ligase [Haematospirillum sp. 15-248]NKD86984.1 arginine--tRNA ligase [Haematospirillum sp. 15-248]
MNVFSVFRDRIVSVLDKLTAEGTLPGGVSFNAVTAEPPRDPSHGDVSTNAAMVLAKAAGMKPLDLAAVIADRLSAVEAVGHVSIAGPGFINIRIEPALWHDVLRCALREGTAFGDSRIGGGHAVNVEYVSANPTGPMHVGHARGACVGDALANLLKKAGYNVAKEYYVNDAGAQIDVLATALYWRYLVACGAVDQAEFDQRLATKEIQYGGGYLIETAQALKERDGTRWVDVPETEWRPILRDFGIESMMQMIRGDLAALGVHPDVFSSEKTIVEARRVEAAEKDLAARDLVYVGVLEPPKGKTPDDWEPRPQTLFRSTTYGDDVDRPLKKSDGSWTYFAGDIAYHYDKYQRGFLKMIDVFGADHGGYVKRMQAAVHAMSDGKASLDVKICQLVKLMDKGEPVKMSKRAGTFVTLRDLIERVGKDVVRFIMLSRKNDVPLDFDYAKVTEQSRDNPVFYVQYAHARASSVRRHFATVFSGVDVSATALAEADLSQLSDPDEMAVIRLIGGWPRVVESAAEAGEPHRITYFLGDVAAGFHALWNKGREHTHLRFLDPDNQPLSVARLALVQGVMTVLASGLAVIGVEPAEEM